MMARGRGSGTGAGAMTDSTHQCPEDVDGEEGDGQGDQPHGLQPALQLQVVLGAAEAQPPGDGSQRRDEQEAGHVAQQRTLLAARPRVLQPLGGGVNRGQWRSTDFHSPTVLPLFLFILKRLNGNNE